MVHAAKRVGGAAEIVGCINFADDTISKFSLVG